MFQTFGEKLREIEEYYENNEYHVVIVESAKLIEHSVNYLFMNFHRTLESTAERMKFLDFEKRNFEKYMSFLKKPTIGVAIGFFNMLLDNFKKHPQVKAEHRTYLNTINTIRNAQLHSGKEAATDNEAAEIIDSAEHFLKDTGLYDKAIESIGFPLKYYLVYTSIKSKFQKTKTEDDFCKIINDSFKIIPGLLNSVFNKVYPFLKIEDKEKLNISHPQTLRDKSYVISIQYFVEIFDEIKLFDKIENGESLRNSLKAISDKDKPSFTKRETRHHVNIIEILINFIQNKKAEHFLDFADNVKNKYLEGNKISDTDRIILNDSAKKSGISVTIADTIEKTVVKTIETELILFQTLHDEVKDIEEKYESKRPGDLKEHIYIHKPKKKLIIIGSGVFLIIICLIIYLIWPAGNFTSLELEKSIAVLPFENLSSDEEQAYFGDAMTDEIIMQLKNIKEFRVISRTSTLQYKDSKKTIPNIGEELNVNYLVEGTVQRQEDNVRIRVQVIRAKNEDHIWGEIYNKEWKDIFYIQSDVAQQIAHELKAVLSPEEIKQIDKQPTDNLEAYDLYLKGRYFWNKRTEKGIKEAIEYFSDAIEKDTNYALAYAGLADCYNMVANYGYISSKDGFQNSVQKGKDAAIKALKIDKTLAEAYTSLAYIKLLYEWDWNGASKDFERAIQLNPDYGTAHQWYANCLTVFKQHDDAIAEAKYARELDPFSPIINRNVGRRLYFARKYDQAIEESLKALNINPDFPPTLWTLGLTYLQKGMFSEAILEMQKAVRYSGDNLFIKALLGYVYGATGNQAKAQVILNGLIETSKEGYVPSIAYAIIYIGLGDNDNAISWLEKAYEERSNFLIYLNINPIYDPLHSDPRFIELVKKMSFE